MGGFFHVYSYPSKANQNSTENTKNKGKTRPKKKRAQAPYTPEIKQMYNQ